MEDYEDCLEVYRAKGSGLKVVNIAHFAKKGEKQLKLSQFVPGVAET